MIGLGIHLLKVPLNTEERIMMEKTTASTGKALGEACASFTTSAMAALPDKVRTGVGNHLEQGSSLHLHVQMTPEFVVVLKLESGDPAKNMELARWSGDVPEAIKRAFEP